MKQKRSPMAASENIVKFLLSSLREQQPSLHLERAYIDL